MRSAVRVGRLAALTAVASVATASSAAAQTAPLPPCSAARWVAAWASVPTDAGKDRTSPLSYGDASLNPSPSFDANTLRAVLTPSRGGAEIRIRLSNRFGETPTTFGHVTVAKRPGVAGAAVAADTVTQVTFGGARDVTVPAGMDVVSDPVAFSFQALERLAVSAFLPNAVPLATRHAAARQTSYVSAPGSGDQVDQPGGDAFSAKTTTRPFVSGLEIRTASSVGAVVAVGDSLTDGAQNLSTGVLESPEGLDQDVRYPDWLARRLRSAGSPLSVLNAGVSGNKLLRDGAEGGNFESFGPALLKRLDADVLAQAGVTTVILWSGINDVSQTPRATPQEVQAGYVSLIGRLHAAGVKVLQATLTPFKGYPQSLAGDPEDEEARRQAVNTWIRTSSPADTIVDFDAAIRDPADPSRLAAAYDDGEHLHLSAAGYEQIANAVPLNELAGARCTHELSVKLSRRSLSRGKLVRLRVLVREDGQSAAGATVRLGAARSVTDARGVAVLRLRPASTGRRTFRVRAADGATKRIAVRVRRLGV